jgi:sugar/nucleoside kinase (ribokinase family)
VAVRLREALGVARVVVSRRVAHGEGLRRESVAVDEAGAVAASSPVFRATEPVGAGDAFCAGFIRGLLTDGVARGLELGGAMAALKQAVPGDAPIVDAHDVELALADEARMQR